MKRIKQALRFNTEQVASMLIFLAPMLVAYYGSEENHNHLVPISICLFWPLVAFIANLITQNP